MLKHGQKDQHIPNNSNWNGALSGIWQDVERTTNPKIIASTKAEGNQVIDPRGFQRNQQIEINHLTSVSFCTPEPKCLADRMRDFMRDALTVSLLQ